MKRAYTLIEVLLSISLVALLAGISIPISQNFIFTNELDNIVNSTVSALRSAENLSQANDSDSTWGMKIQTGAITLFKGTSYAARDTSYDKDYVINTSAAISGTTEIVFNKLTGEPQTPGSIIVSLNSSSRTLIINAKGVITY